MSGRSRADLLKFLDWMAEKGLLPANTASSRKASANKILAMLSDEEATDVTSLDVDDLVQRFGTKYGQKYNPDSVLTYKSRLRSALEDFRAYCDNPVGFRPAGRTQSRTRSVKEPITKSASAAANEPPQPSETPARAAPVHVLPIAVRPDVTVHIGNLPVDLTEKEARRIANIILAYAVSAD